MNGWMIAIMVGLMLALGCIGGSGGAGETPSAGSSSGTPEPNDALEELSEEVGDAVEDVSEAVEDASVGPGEEPEPVVDYTECVDTDGGDDKYTFGQIKLVTHYTDGSMEEEILAEDKCVGKNIVQEYLCRKGGSSDYRKMEWTCLNCEDGACTE